jgi:hypothetical protein
MAVCVMYCLVVNKTARSPIYSVQDLLIICIHGRAIVHVYFNNSIKCALARTYREDSYISGAAAWTCKQKGLNNQPNMWFNFVARLYSQSKK